MTKRDFFIIVIRLFGLYALIISVFSILPSSISFLSYTGRIDGYTILLTIVSILIPFGIMILLLFKANNLVSFLKLDKGFDDEKIYLENLSSESILRLGLIVIGGFLILDNIAWFLNSTLEAFKTDLSRQILESQFKTDWIIVGINLVIGILLVTNFKSISRILNRKIED